MVEVAFYHIMFVQIRKKYFTTKNVWKKSFGSKSFDPKTQKRFGNSKALSLKMDDNVTHKSIWTLGKPLIRFPTTREHYRLSIREQHTIFYNSDEMGLWPTHCQGLLLHNVSRDICLSHRFRSVR